MALSTFTELKASIANFLNRSDLTTEIQDDFIKLCEADFNAKLRIRQMEQIDDVTINAEKNGMLKKYKLELNGSNSKAIANAEDRKKFRKI